MRDPNRSIPHCNLNCQRGCFLTRSLRLQVPASPRSTAAKFLQGVGERLDIQDATMLSLTVDGSIEPKLTMPISTLATRNLEIRINEDMSYQDEVNAAGNLVKQFAAVLQEQVVAGDEYQDITETPEAKEIIQLLRVLLEGYEVQPEVPSSSRGPSGCGGIVDDIVTWFEKQVKTCQSLNEIRIALLEDFPPCSSPHSVCCQLSSPLLVETLEKLLLKLGNGSNPYQPKKKHYSSKCCIL